MTGPTVHPIEAKSYRILDGLADLSAFGPTARHVAARVVHASADLEYASTLVAAEEDVVAGVRARRDGAPVLCDVEMVRAGLATATGAVCGLGPGPVAGETRSAAGIRAAARAHPIGAVVVVGCAPTALFEVLRLHEEEGFSPALVIGLPVGFVGAAESKEALRSSGLPAVSNVGPKGGSAVAAAAFNAIDRLARG